MITVTTKSGHDILLDDDMAELAKLSWQLNSTGYARRTVRERGSGKYRTQLMHRIIMNCPTDKVIDHINGNKLDNRRSNLRVCTRGENLRNRKTSSKYIGVSKHTERRWSTNRVTFVAQISFNGKKIYKRFNTELDAVTWRENKLDELGDSFSLRNKDYA